MKKAIIIILLGGNLSAYSQWDFRNGGSCFPDLKAYSLKSIDSNLNLLQVESIFFNGDSQNGNLNKLTEKDIVYLSKFKNLKELSISETNIDSLPYVFKNLEKLECLKIVNVNFKIQPKIISDLKGLKRLFINSKSVNLDSINITKLKSSLVEFDYYSRKDTLENCIGTLYKLQTIDLLMSDFVKYIPNSFCTLNNLQIFDLKFTRINYLPECISIIKSLNVLDIRNTPISRMPTKIYDIPKLKLLISGGCDNFKRYFSDKAIIDLVNTHPENWRIIIDSH